ncbi:MAG: hypothetical protein QXT77_07470, partial [Candidatus Methanomethylicaceae archaeon]
FHPPLTTSEPTSNLAHSPSVLPGVSPPTQTLRRPEHAPPLRYMIPPDPPPCIAGQNPLHNLTEQLPRRSSSRWTWLVISTYA